MNIRHGVIAERKTKQRKQDNEYQHGAHDAEQRKPRGFHGCQLIILSQVTKGHDRGKQHRQRHGAWDKHQESIEEHFSQGQGIYSFACDLINVGKYKYHEKHEHRNEKRSQEWRDVLFYEIYIQGFQALQK